MAPLDLAPLDTTYRGRGKAPHRPDLMLAIVLFELRRGKRQPNQWHQDTLETYPLWWLGFGIHPSRSCWYEFRDRAGAYVDTLNTQLLHQAVEAELTTAARVRTEFALEVLLHNLLTVHRSLRQRLNAKAIKPMTEKIAA
jgi:hypothetical protein